MEQTNSPNQNNMPSQNNLRPKDNTESKRPERPFDSQKPAYSNYSDSMNYYPYYNPMVMPSYTKSYGVDNSAVTNTGNYKFQMEFPRAKSYSNINDIIEAFPHLKTVNKNDLDIKKITEAKCFVLRSNNDDDIHKAIKYGIWTSNPRNNSILNKAYEEMSQKGSSVFLFYSVVKSGQFVGVARLTSGYKDKDFHFWWQGPKWKGQFSIEWLYIKDLVYKNFEKIKNITTMPVIRSKDCTEVEFPSNGQEMLEIFQSAANEPNIFQEFPFMDAREDQLRYHIMWQSSFYYSMQPPQYYSYPYNSNFDYLSYSSSKPPGLVSHQHQQRSGSNGGTSNYYQGSGTYSAPNYGNNKYQGQGGSYQAQESYSNTQASVAGVTKSFESMAISSNNNTTGTVQQQSTQGNKKYTAKFPGYNFMNNTKKPEKNSDAKLEDQDEEKKV